MSSDLRALITDLALKLDQSLPGEKVDSLGRFGELVQTWNARMNLTAAREPGDLVEVLFADALVAASGTLVPEGAFVLDVGSGAGAPAIPLFLLRPDLKGVLAEPLRKRVAFMRTAIGSLALAPRVRALEARVEPESPEVADGPFDVAISRATWAPQIWAKVGLALAPRVLVLTAATDPPAPPAGARKLETERYALPFSGAPRAIAVYERHGEA